ncbi:MAG: hypothetical protein JKY56_16245 [Kofleriaceae bacterium]|nr:hypothetical protein [Kofleriaceae bacterium]
MKTSGTQAFFLALLGAVTLACGDNTRQKVPRPMPPANDGIFSFANGCFSIDATKRGSENTRWLAPSGTDEFEFEATSQDAGSKFFMRASDLGTYLFYDAERYYLSVEEGALTRVDRLDSDILLLDDEFKSPAEWELQVSAHDAERFQLVHYQTGQYLGTKGLVESEMSAAVVAFYPESSESCAVFPEMELNAEGTVERTTWPDGDVYGFVDTHEHLLTNYGFGGGGMFHGGPFHRLGVQHALGSCEPYHGAEGRRDLIGYLFSGLGEVDTDALVDVLLTGMTPEFNHFTDGFPTFGDWPSSWEHATHQMQYYKWLERAYLSGLRLFVQHTTSNSVLCELMEGIETQKTRYSCNDMVATDRQIAETYNLERYIDAQSGGPGLGWFRVVTSPAEAREVIEGGKMAVILGIETSNLFDCFLTPRVGFEPCTAESIRSDLDRYREMGVRAIFPTHKFDNAFSAGDGDRNVGQIGSVINSGHNSNFIEDCPDSPTVFDKGNVTFGGLNEPRENYDDPAQNDTSAFANNPIITLISFFSQLMEPALEGDYCQKTGLTALGETLIVEMMQRGMLVEVDHLPRRAIVRAYEILVENDYPALGTHGNSNRGMLYEIGGVGKTGFNACGTPGVPGAMGERLRNRIQEITDAGAYPAEGFGFDLNGFAGGPRPRFGEDSTCPQPQENPVTYPFTSLSGDVTFSEPTLGERSVDFSREGMLHIGLLPELIEDARRDGVSDKELEPLFRSAEGYLRMWERAEARAAAMTQ